MDRSKYYKRYGETLKFQRFINVIISARIRRGFFLVMASLILIAAYTNCSEFKVTQTSEISTVTTSSFSPVCDNQAVMLGEHPHAKLQNTTRGRQLREAKGWKGKMYWGYGDLIANTGPVWITAYDPTTKQWEDLFQFDTEEIGRFREIGNQLWIAAADPRGVADPEYAIADNHNNWQQVNIGQSNHIMDVVAGAPGEIFLVGSRRLEPFAVGDGAAVWRSVNNGPFELIFPNATAFDTTTYMFDNAAYIGGQLFAQSAGLPKVFDGVSWKQGPDLGQFTSPVTLAGKIIFEALQKLWSFDGRQTALIDIDVAQPPDEEYRIDQQSLYRVEDDNFIVVTHNYTVQYSKDLVTWKCAGKAPVTASSLGVLNGVIYFGTTDSKIYSFESPTF